MPTNISLANAKCTFHESQIFVLLPQNDSTNVPIYSFNPEFKKWVKVDIKNESLLNSDAEHNFGEEYELETKIEEQHGLQIWRGFTNGASCRYLLDLESLEWCQVPRTPNKIYTELLTSKAKYRILCRSRSEFYLQMFVEDKLIYTTDLVDIKPKFDHLKLVGDGEMVYIVRMNYQAKKRSISKIESNGAVVMLNSQKYTHERQKTEIWAKNGKIFCFRYGREMTFECFDTQTVEWNRIKLDCQSHIRDVISFYHHKDMIYIVYRSIQTSEFADSNTIGIVCFELISSLVTSSLMHFSTKILEKKLIIDDVLALIPNDKMNAFYNLHALHIDRIIARQKYETRKLERARARLLARRNNRGFIN